jgi:phage terminase small subunit
MARKLTEKQEAFRQAYMETGNGRQAYKLAYDAQGMSDKAIDKEVRALLKNPLLNPLSDKIQLQVEAKAVLSLEEHMEKLKDLRDKAEAEGKFTAAIQAEVKRGELRRFYIKQVETGDVGAFSQMSNQELVEFIKREDEALERVLTRH